MRHFETHKLSQQRSVTLDRAPLLFNADVAMSYVQPTATDESNSDAERGVNATTDAPQSSSSSDEGDHDAASPVTPTPTRAPSGG